MIKPRDLHYEDGKIVVRLEKETDKQREERESQGLDNMNSQNAKMFNSEIFINKKVKSEKNDVVYIESIKFLLQTL